jgi:hypothetical protein
MQTGRKARVCRTSVSADPRFDYRQMARSEVGSRLKTAGPQGSAGRGTTVVDRKCCAARQGAECQLLVAGNGLTAR